MDRYRAEKRGYDSTITRWMKCGIKSTGLQEIEHR
jgi:hypothetical protein